MNAAVLFVILFVSSPLRADSLDDLARDFWAWRAAEQPTTPDDILRLERPSGWLPDWSPASVGRYQKQMEEFEARWEKMDASSWPVSRQVDYRLMGSAIARVRWELDVNRSWQRNPTFYLEQSAGSYLDLLLEPAPFGAQRSRDILAMLQSIPRTLEDGRKNLTQPVAPFTRLALDHLHDLGPRLLRSVRAVKPLVDPEVALSIDGAAVHAVIALESYRIWLSRRLSSMPSETAVGRDAYLFFLKNVALLPFTPEQLLAMGRQEWARSVASQSYEEHRNSGVPQLAIFKDQKDQITHEAQDELAVRSYLEAKNILTVPADAPHYRFAPMPGYIAPLTDFGEADDFTGPGRLTDGGTRYISPPSADLGYFSLSMAKDPRAIIVHEGVPGHYFQLVLSWGHPDIIRRHYYDSGANEGIGFYAEEMMLQAGLFDDSPRSREVIWNFMRLRALRVEVDVKLALGQFTLEQAAEYLKNTVPMDSQTAHAEASSFASGPGQAISYEIGKLQLYRFLADTQRQKKDAFNLRAFHDFVWQNGNVPIVLQRWEFLGMKDEVEAIDQVH
jgi:uncharacterized protein (DUF885 family)